MILLLVATLHLNCELKQIVDQIIPEFGMYFIRKIKIVYVFLGKNQNIQCIFLEKSFQEYIWIKI